MILTFDEAADVRPNPRRTSAVLNYGLVEAAPERIPVGIGQAGGENPHPAGVVLYFVVDDVEAALDRAERLGGGRAMPPWEIPGMGKMAVFHDPDGNRVGLWQA